MIFNNIFGESNNKKTNTFELKSKFYQYLQEKNKTEDANELLSEDISIFMFSSDFQNFLKEEGESLGLSENLSENISDIFEMEFDEENCQINAGEDASEEQQTIAGLINELFKQDDVKSTSDTDGDGKVSKQEMTDFLAAMNKLDSDDENLSLEDIFGVIDGIKDGTFTVTPGLALGETGEPGKTEETKETEEAKAEEPAKTEQPSSSGNSNPYNANIPSATPAPSKGPTEVSEGIAKEVGDIEAQIAQKNSEIATKNAEKAALKADDATYKGLLDNLDTATKAVDTAAQNITKYETELHAIETSINTKKAQLENISDPVVFTEYKEDFDKQKATLQSEIKDLEDKQAKKQEDIEKEKQTKTEKETEKKNLETQVAEYEAANPNAEIDKINQEISTLKSDIQSLEAQKATKETELEKSRETEKSDATVYGEMKAIRENNEFTKWLMDYATSDGVRNKYDNANWGGAWCAVFTSDMTEALYAEVAKRIGNNGLSNSSQGMDGLQMAMHAVAWGNKYQGDLNSLGINKKASIDITHMSEQERKDAVRKGLIYPGMTFEYESNGGYHTGFVESINADLTWNTVEGNSTGGKIGAHRRDATNQRLSSVTDSTLKIYAWLVQRGKMTSAEANKRLQAA